MGVAEGDDLLGRQVEAERIPPDREAVGQLLEQLDPALRGPSGQDVLVEGDLRQVCEGGGGDGAPLAVVSPDSLVAHETPFLGAAEWGQQNEPSRRWPSA